MFNFLKKSKITLVVSILILLYIINLILPKTKANLHSSWYKNSNGAPLVIAHQGGNQERPSSTNLAFEHAVEIGVDILEFDVALTKDDKLITIHDLTVDRNTDGTGRVIDKTYSEIRKLNAAYGLEDKNGQPIRNKNKNPYIEIGAYIPTLEEVFNKYGNKKMIIELKDSGENGQKSARVFWNLVKKYNMTNNVVVACFDKDTLKELRLVSNDKVITSASENEMYYFYGFYRTGLSSLNNFINFEMLHIPLSYNVKGVEVDLLTNSLLKYASKRNIPIYYWTINSEENMNTLIDKKVDGIMTDRPEKLIKILKEKNLR